VNATRPTEAPKKVDYILSASGVEKVGDPDRTLNLGSPLPRALLDGIAERYVAKYVADVQPFDGFRFDDPPAVVKLINGPFAQAEAKSSFVESGPPLPGSKTHRNLALLAAKMAEKMRVTWIEVSSELPQTSKGAHVGLMPDELLMLHPEATPFASSGYYSDSDCGYDLNHRVIFFQETRKGACDAKGRIAHIWIQ